MTLVLLMAIDHLAAITAALLAAGLGAETLRGRIRRLDPAAARGHRAAA